MRLTTSDARWTAILESLNNSNYKGDVLVTMNTLQLIIDECGTEANLLALDSLAVVERIFRMAEDELLDNLIRSHAMTVIATFASIECSLVDQFEERYRLGPFLQKCLNNNFLKEKVYLVVSRFFTNKFVTGSWVEEIVCQDSFVEPIFHGHHSVVDAIVNMFAPPAQLLIEARQMRLYKVLEQVTRQHPIDAIIELTITPDESTKITVYQLLQVLVRQPWILSEAIGSSRLIAFLLDRTNDPSMIAAEAHFEIIQTVLASTIDIPAPLIEQLDLYLKQGVQFTPRTMHVASQRHI